MFSFKSSILRESEKLEMCLVGDSNRNNKGLLKWRTVKIIGMLTWKKQKKEKEGGKWQQSLHGQTSSVLCWGWRTNKGNGRSQQDKNVHFIRTVFLCDKKKEYSVTRTNHFLKQRVSNPWMFQLHEHQLWMLLWTG